MKINYIITSLFFLFNNFTSLFSQSLIDFNEIENDTMITWNNKNKIKWSDFKGEKTIYSNSKAESGIGINMEPFLHKNLVYEYLVFAYFDKKKSTTKVQNDYLLKHEQMHFNIGEIFARRIRKEIIKQKESNVENIYYEKIYNRLYNKCLDFHRKYDEETKHSKDFYKQKEWNNLILDELNSLEKYSYKNYLNFILKH
ncbi:hypothetical protein [Tenacibaculum aiptasiae]|uniref:hypothetical protein n=1 Tax=Tenacibaculum aiptasiae TaxID=426481 RepID=UPI00232F3BD2|nr:hypothetical protein [Tenacibaculum aiptasiae]